MRKPRLLLLVVGGVLLAFVLIVLVAGMLLPEEHRASKALTTRQSPQVIWDTINDHANEASWRSDVSHISSLGERNGRPVW